MNSITEKIMQPTFLLALLAALKLILQPFGVEIPDQQANEVINGICALATILGIYHNHDVKKVAEPVQQNVEIPLQPPAQP